MYLAGFDLLGIMPFVALADEESGSETYPFALSVGEVVGYEADGYSYYYYVQDSETEEWNAVESISALYTVLVPAGTTELTLTFDEERIAYAYADMGTTYIASCAKDKADGYANNGQTGETTAYVRPTDEGTLPAYVQVQTPYDESWSSTTLYAVAFVELPFKLSAGEVTGYEQDGYSYYYYVQDSETEEWNAVESVSALYTVTVPTGTTELTLTFDEARIAYAYADMGVTYIASCAKDKTAGYANNGQTGETTAYVRPTDKRKLPAYVQVQTPYDESWSSTTLYAVTFVEALPSDAEGHWAEEYIRYVFDNGLMIGTGADTFAPEEPLTRAMLVTILYRLEGEPETAFDSRFDDVTEGKWYSDAVSWAAKEGLVLGYGDGTFGPAEPITREQFATILYRYAASGDSAAADLSAYEDADAISKWAKDAVTWAVGTGLIRGMTKTTLVPQGTSTRAQAAAILTRYLKA